jgi:two-component system, chemotaxis family, chemotaxis protein CheY
MYMTYGGTVVFMATVLITDDSVYMRDLIKAVLARSSHTVIAEASGGQECLEKYQEKRPDVVLLDNIMPEMKGLETLRELISIDPGARVIMVSADHQDQSVQLAAKYGAKGFIVKPFLAETVTSEIDAVMQQDKEDS